MTTLRPLFFNLSHSFDQDRLSHSFDQRVHTLLNVFFFS